MEEIYNPLDKRHLADSIARAFFARPIHPLPPVETFRGAGIYAIYYKGEFPLYKEISNSYLEFESTSTVDAPFGEIKQPIPIYIGKSDAPGSRKGFSIEALNSESTNDGDEKSSDLDEAEQFLTKAPKHRRLYDRLVKHSKSIGAAKNLSPDSFFCRYMFVDEIWVPLGEARLVELFKPLWNVMIEGFGSNPEGGGREKTARPVWDIIHPGRKEDLKIRVDPSIESEIVNSLQNAKTKEDLRNAISEHRKARGSFNKSEKSKKVKS